MAAEASGQLVRRALAAAAGIGPFFALADGSPDPADRAPDPGSATGAAAPASWRPAACVYRAGPDFLRAAAGDELSAAEPRAAVSIMQLGYAARLWSPVLGSALLGGVVPDLGPLRIEAGPPLRLGLREWHGWLADSPEQAAALSYHVVIEQHLAPMAAAGPRPLAAGLAAGNAASAMTGALGVLATARPDLAGPARAVAVALLRTGSLRGTGQLTGAGLAFRRRSCCLYYRLPGGALCGDCCLRRRPGRHVARRPDHTDRPDRTGDPG